MVPVPSVILQLHKYLALHTVYEEAHFPGQAHRV